MLALAFASGFTHAGSPLSIAEGVLDSNKVNLGLDKIDGATTVTVFSPTESSDHYVNGVVMAGFKGKLFCQWQSSATDEDSEDTWVAYSIGSRTYDAEGRVQETWSAPKILARAISGGYRTSGGWVVYGDTLVAFVNEWPDSMSVKGGFAYYTQSSDGISWSELKPVLMDDGSPMMAVFEQDPHRVGNRLINAAHFQPGLLANPIYTDDLSGRTGWVRASFTNMEHSGTSSREMEPSLYVKKSSEIVMTFRDQNSSYRRLASVSRDNGGSWSMAELTNMPDSRAKQSAGNLPDSSAYLVGNPVTNKTRIPLSIVLSDEGTVFTRAFNLRTQDEIPELLYEGTAKREGYHYPKSARIGDFLYVSYATNKEHAEYTRIPLEKICNYAPVADTVDNEFDSVKTDAGNVDMGDDGEKIADSVSQGLADGMKSVKMEISLVENTIVLNTPYGISKFSLYDVLGNKIYSRVVNQGMSVVSIEACKFAPGIYYAGLTCGASLIMKKIVIR